MLDCFKKLEDPLSYKLVLKAIEDGNIHPKYLNLFYELFYKESFTEYQELKTAFFMSIVKHSNLFDQKLFSEAFGCNITSMELFKKYETRSFPICNNNSGELAKIYIFKIDVEGFPVTFPNSSQYLKRDLENVKHALGENFFVCFDKRFVGDSFGLALASAFYVKNEFEKYYAFTGSIKADGTVEKVDFLDEKRKVAKENSKYLVSYKNVNHISELEILNTESIQTPFIQLFGKSEAALMENFHKLCEVTADEKILSIFGLNLSKLSVFVEDRIKNDAETWLKLFEEAFEKIDFLNKIGLRANIHYLLSISAFAFPLGIKQGAINKTAIYHYQMGEIHRVFDFLNRDPRVLKRKVEKYEFIKSEYKDIGSNELCVGIYLASHDPKKDAEYFALESLHANFLYISIPTFQGQIPLENTEIWEKIVRELYSKIDYIANNSQKNITHYHFIFSVPVPIAFALGMAIGNYKRISVYNFFQSTTSYEKVFSNLAFRNIF